MAHIPRLLAAELKRATGGFPVIILTGPRRAGKTYLLQRCFPRASYHLLEDPDVIARVQSDPRAFLDEAGSPAILDEIQNVPELLNYIRSRADRSGGRSCKWLITGSQEAGLMRGVTESMAGRAAIFQLLPLSVAESGKVTVVRGGFPEALAMPATADIWFRSYIQTYLERDVRAISSIRNLATFRRFLAMLASRAGQVLNRTEIAAPLGVSIPTVSEWIGILETTMQVMLVHPFYENLGKRLIKSPKIYFTDSGLLCHLLGIKTEAELMKSPFAGPVFEGFVAAEIAKAQINAGKRREIYFFRDRQGLEVDFLVPTAGRRIVLIEAKASLSVRPEAAISMIRLVRSLGRYKTESFVVGRHSADRPGMSALAPGVRLIGLDSIYSVLFGK
jgi:hypothetical protein